MYCLVTAFPLIWIASSTWQGHWETCLAIKKMSPYIYIYIYIYSSGSSACTLNAISINGRQKHCSFLRRCVYLYGASSQGEIYFGKTSKLNLFCCQQRRNIAVGNFWNFTKCSFFFGLSHAVSKHFFTSDVRFVFPLRGSRTLFQQNFFYKFDVGLYEKIQRQSVRETSEEYKNKSVRGSRVRRIVNSFI